MRFLPAVLPGVLVIEPDVYADERGFFLETYHCEKYRRGGIGCAFVQDNNSHSVRGTVRGLHAQRRRQQAKLVRVLQGEIFDVVVDIRRGSPTFRRWCAVELSAANFRQCYIPPGFAHGFCVTSDVADVEYKCTEFYDPEDELCIRWDDPQLGIAWPGQDPILPLKDSRAPRLAEMEEFLPVFAGKTT